MLLAWLPQPANACVTPRIEDNEDNKVIVLQNTCKEYVSWALCVRVSERSFDDYPVGVVAPKGTSQYALFVSPDARVSVQLNWCKGRACKVIQPRCIDPEKTPAKSATPSQTRFCPADMSTWPSSTRGADEHNKLVEMCKVAFPDMDPERSSPARSNQGPPKRQATEPNRAQQEAKRLEAARQQQQIERNRQIQNSILQGLGAAAQTLSGQSTRRPPSAAPAPSSNAASTQFPCRDRVQYDACVPQYISRGLPYGYEGQDIRQVAHQYCARNFCQ
jgi:hypothetical protein